jgi:uncharacterized membrane protein
VLAPRGNDREMRVATAILVLLAVSVVVMLPVLIYGYPVGAHDAKWHATWARNFAKVLWDGTWYPRWLPDMDGGLGSPTFFYYPPVGYYIAALFDFRPDAVRSGVEQLRFATPAILFGSACAMFYWLSGFVSRRAALIGAILFAVLPYHLFDLFERGAVAEFDAFLFAPLVLAGLERSTRAKLPAVAGIAIPFALLAMTHPLAAFICAPAYAIYALALAAGARRASLVLNAAGGGFLGVALAAVYLVPSLTTRDAVQFPTERLAFYDLVFGPGWLEHLETFEIGVSALSIVTTIIFVAILWRNRRQAPAAGHLELRTWSAIGLAYALSTTVIAEPLFRHIPMAQVIQFPMRLNIVIDMALAALAALLSERMEASGRRAILIACAALGLAHEAVPIVLKHFDIDRTYWANVDGCEFDNSDYRPAAAAAWFCGNPVSPLQKDPSAKAWLAGTGSIAVDRWRSRRIALTIDASAATTLYVAQFAYPGWTARLDDGTPVATATSSDGILSFAVPAGRHEIDVDLMPRRPELIGQWISLGALLLIAALAWRRRPGANKPADSL